MQKGTKKSKALLGLAVSGLVLGAVVGCGSGGDKKSTPSGSTPPPTTTKSPAADPSKSADKSAAKSDNGCNGPDGCGATKTEKSK